MAIKIPRFLRHLRDVEISSPADGEVLTYDDADGNWKNEVSVGGGGGAPTTADYLVGTTQGGLSSEIVVGASPGGELGGTWATPTVDAVHSGSSHAATQSAAEATAAGALASHDADTTGIHGIADTSALITSGTFNDHSARHEDGGADEISVQGLSGTPAALQTHLDDASDAHDASAVSFVPTGTIAATDVQAAIAEVASEAGGTSVATLAVNQAAHGLAVGNVIRLSGTSYVKAQANSEANAEAVGLVSAVADANNFTIQSSGRITGLASLTAGAVYFLDDDTAGLLTTTEPPDVGDVSKPLLIADTTTSGWIFNMRGFIVPAAGTTGAPGDATYLVGAAHADLSAEIVVGATPGGELGGTWASPTVDATHSGSSHAGIQAAAEATAAAALAAHTGDTTDAHDASAISILDAASDFTATEVEGALAELQAADEADEAALAAHLADASDAHDASAISFVPAGTIAATDVQAAIAEVASEVGAAVTIPYLFNTATAEADPGVGHLAFDNANADLVTKIRIDPTDRNGGDWTSILNHLAASTEPVLGLVQIVQDGTTDTWWFWEITDISPGAGSYYNAAVVAEAQDNSPPGTPDTPVTFLFSLAGQSAAAGAPTTADYLVGTTQGGLSAEIVVGATPGGELGGTWAAPTVDATHSGSSHAAVQSAAEATAAAALAAHTGDTTDAHDASAISILDAASDFTATEVEGALAELQSDHEADATALSDHIADVSAAHAASAVSYAGGTGMSATDVEAAIDELATEKLDAATYNARERSFTVKVVDDTTVLTTGDGKTSVPIADYLNGLNLVDADAAVVGTSSSGLPTIQLRRVRAGTPADMLSTRITIDVSELDSYSANAQPVIDTANDDVATGDRIFVDVDVAGTGADGLDVILSFA